jgi:hypothetical protein
MTMRLEAGYPREKGRGAIWEYSTGSYLSLVLLGRGWCGVTRMVGIDGVKVGGRAPKPQQAGLKILSPITHAS